MHEPIRMSDFRRRRRFAIAPGEAARQFRVSAVLAIVMIAASLIVAAGALLAPSRTAQTPAPAAAARVS
ncbi:MAG: hypothetical protein ACOYJQ_00610 [Pseudochelatococcus sp.]